MSGFRIKLQIGLFAALTSVSACPNAVAQQSVIKVQIVADAMCCNGCAQRVGAQLYTLPGVSNVQADVPKRLVSVTAKPSPKLTLERIWKAVEQGKGGPSKLIASHAIYVLTPPASLKPEQQLPAGRYTIQVRAMKDQADAQKIANQIHTIGGVEKINVDVAQRALFIHTAKDVALSPWALATAVDQAQSQPTLVAGSFGILTVESTAPAQRSAANPNTNPQTNGEVR